MPGKHISPARGGIPGQEALFGAAYGEAICRGFPWGAAVSGSNQARRS